MNSKNSIYNGSYKRILFIVINNQIEENNIHFPEPVLPTIPTFEIKKLVKTLLIIIKSNTF